MGFGRKVGEGGVSRWLLLLTGVLLLVAVTATAGDAGEEGATTGEDSLRGSRPMCELKCQHHHDPVNKKRCIDFCIRYQLLLDAVKEEDEAVATILTGEDSLRGSRRMCEIKCQHHHDPVNKKRCVDFCIRYQLALDAVKEDDGATATIITGEGGLRGSRHMCEIKCQHHHDPVNKKRCIDFCIRYQLALDAVKEEDGATATIITGEDSLRGSRHMCEIKCQHHHDPVNKKRCVDFCIRYQLALDAVKEDDGAAATIITGEDNLHGSQHMCEIKCQHHHDPVNKKRCVDFCIRYQLALDAVKEDDGAAATIITGEDNLHGSQHMCEIKCQHHHDPVNKKRCVDFCIRYQLVLDAVKEDDGATATILTSEDNLRGSRHICEIKCQHHHDPVNKKRCIDFCIRYQLALDAVKEDDGAAATIITGEDSLRGSRHICEIKCQHHHDPVNKKRCVEFCIRYQLALDVVKEDDGATATILTGEDRLRSSRRMCEIKCQHHHDPVNKKRCVDFCIRYQLALDAVKEDGGATAIILTGEDSLGSMNKGINDGATATAAGGAIRQVV